MGHQLMRIWGFFSPPVCLYFQLVRGMAEGLEFWIKILLTYEPLISKSIFLLYAWFANILFSERLKDVVIAQQKAEERPIFWLLQVEQRLLCTTGLQTVSKRLETDTEQEQQGSNWVAQMLRITQPNLNSMKPVNKPTSEKYEPSPLRLRRSGKVEWNLHSFGATVAVVHWLTWKKSTFGRDATGVGVWIFSSTWLFFF